MIPAKGWENKKVAVLGLGRSGMAAVRSLLEGKATVIAWDDQDLRREQAQNLGAPLKDLMHISWENISGLVLSPGIPHQFPKPHPIVSKALQKGVPLVSDVDVLYQSQHSCRFIGITGTNGKSTTTALVTHLLKTAGFPAQAGGNIGRAALDLDIFSGNQQQGIYVLELSSYQLELLKSVHFEAGLLLNIQPDHLERHGGFPGYVAAKQKLFDHVKGFKVICVDDPECLTLYKHHQKRRESESISFSCKDFSVPLHVKEGLLKDKTRFPEREIDLTLNDALKAPHNWQNALGAYAVLRHFNIPWETLRKGFETFSGLEHRQEFVPSPDAILYINDSKATNMNASLQALKAFQNIFWLLGGEPKDEDYTLALPFASKIKKAYAFGKARPKIKKAFHNHIQTSDYETLDEALSQARQDALQYTKSCHETLQPVILLSPACASFDQFKDFEERGNTFKHLVKEMDS